MPELNIRIHDANTGETIDRPMTDEEADTYTKSIELTKKVDNLEHAKRQSAVNKLIDLGLTEEEVKAFLG